MDQKPPKLATHLLYFFLKHELREEVSGDLEEQFLHVLKEHSKARAVLNYWFQVINYMRPFALKHIRSTPMFFIMFRHNIIISLRTVFKNKTFSLINIGGLALGMTVSIFIGLWIFDEYSFNKHHQHYDRLVQVYRKHITPSSISVGSAVPGALGLELTESYPHLFEDVTMTFYRPNNQLITYNERTFNETGYFFQEDAPHLFTLNMLAGTRNALENPSNIILSESMGRKLFGTEDPMGKTVRVNTRVDLIVQGIYEDLPDNSTLGGAQYFLPLSLVYNKENPYVWDNYNVKMFALLKEGVSVSNASAAIKDVINNIQDESDRKRDLLLLPMKDWHLNSTFEDGIQVTSRRIQFIRLYTTIGIFILLIACINFMNLNTAQFQKRGKEVGVRKAMGSMRGEVAGQFLMESFMYALGALMISLIIVYALLPYFSALSGKEILGQWANPWFWLCCIGFCGMVALMAGGYPAVFLSSYSPINALKGKLRQGRANTRFRQGLVVFQFTISIVLIISTLTIDKQIQYAKDRPTGYEKEGLVTLIARSQSFADNAELLRSELIASGVVEEMGMSNYPLTNTLGSNGGFRTENTEEVPVYFNTIFVSPEYGKATKWDLADGRDFNREFGDEKNAIIISESAAEAFGLENPVGQQILSKNAFNDQSSFEVVGVVKDMIKGSPFDEPVPLILFPTRYTGFYSYVFVRLNPEVAVGTAISEMERIFKEVNPGHPFEYYFAEDQFMSKFRAEEQVGGLATLFSILAIIISCLGLFGLSAFMATQRVKEIGIRKVMGASITSLWALLSKDFGVLVLIACLISVPIGAYAMNSWLQDYEYRISLDWTVYGMSVLLSLFVAFATVSYHSIKASITNPVQSLRTE
ncbi:MAG: ABC transporter permease [Bacteroidota bacterium]